MEKELKELALDLNKAIETVQGQYKELGTLSQDTAAQAKGLQEKLDGISKNQEKFDAQLKAIGEDSIFKTKTKNEGFDEQLKKGLAEKIQTVVKNGGLKWAISANLENGHETLNTKVATMTSAANLTGDLPRAYGSEVISAPFRKIHMRSIVPNSPLASAWYTYPKDLGTGDNGVAIQTEASAKGQSDYDVELVDVKPVTIAHFASVALQMIEDLGWLSNHISTQMVEQLLNLEDSKILTGTGGSNNIDGILNQAANYTKTNSSVASNMYEYLLDAMAQLEGSNYSPSNILVHPQDFFNLLVFKTTANEYTHPALAVTGGISLAGVPVSKATAISRLTGLVGDFSKTELLIKSGLKVDMSYEDNDNFRKNLVTVRVEERVAFAVYQSTAFLKMNFNQLFS